LRELRKEELPIIFLQKDKVYFQKQFLQEIASQSKRMNIPHACIQQNTTETDQTRSVYNR